MVTVKLGRFDGQMAKMQGELNALKEMQQNQGGDEEVKEESEEEKLRKWMEDEVKLPQYLDLLKEDGFDDPESVQELTEDDLKAMSITKTGHRRKIMKNVARLKATNNPEVTIQSVSQPAPAAAAYSFGVA